MRHDLHELYPTIYKGVLETDILADIGNRQFERWFSQADAARKNQFVLTADLLGIEAFERIYEIKADPTTEDLPFRRQRILNRMRMRVPFTFPFLLERLDELIGEGKYRAWLGQGKWNSRLGRWKLGAALRDPEYTLFIEAAGSDVHWHQEVQVFVGKIKPANIVYVLSPRLGQRMVMGETIGTYPRRWNYHLGKWRLGFRPFLSDVAREASSHNYSLGKWRLGSSPFGEPPNMEVLKMPGVPSLTGEFFNLHAQFTAAEITAVRLNGSYLVEKLDKTAGNGVTTLQYVVTPFCKLPEITQVELLTEEGSVLASAGIFVPVPAADQLTFRHTITHEEVT